MPHTKASEAAQWLRWLAIGALASGATWGFAGAVFFPSHTDEQQVFLAFLLAGMVWPSVVGRRNWLYADTVGGASASANLYSLIETAKANGIEPYRYLCALFAALPNASRLEDYEALLPWRIALASQ